MTVTRTILPVLALAAVAVPAAAGTAQAAIKNPQADAAMRKGIRDVARLEADNAKATNIRVVCVAVPKVGDRKPCSGSFDLTKDGRTAHYVLTGKARTFRISPGAIEYRVSSHVSGRVAGFPARTDLLGFLQ
jgi:hypothetical protein